MVSAKACQAKQICCLSSGEFESVVPWPLRVEVAVFFFFFLIYRKVHRCCSVESHRAQQTKHPVRVVATKSVLGADPVRKLRLLLLRLRLHVYGVYLGIASWAGHRKPQKLVHIQVMIFHLFININTRCVEIHLKDQPYVRTESNTHLRVHHKVLLNEKATWFAALSVLYRLTGFRLTG